MTEFSAVGALLGALIFNLNLAKHGPGQAGHKGAIKWYLPHKDTTQANFRNNGKKKNTASFDFFTQDP